MAGRKSRLANSVPRNFTVVQLRTDHQLIRNLYLEADRLYEGKVELLSDKIVKEYIAEHRGYRRLTTYIGYATEYIYNVRLEIHTKMELDDFCGSFHNGVTLSEVIKAALYNWELSLRDKYEKT